MVNVVYGIAMLQLLRTQELVGHVTPGGNTTTALAAPSTGAAQILVVRQTQEPGGANPLHHKSTEALVVVTDGAVAVGGPGGEVGVGAGEAVLVAAGTLHQIRATSESAASWLVVTPAGVAFTAADGTPVHPVWAG